MNWHLSRREFIKTSATGVAFALTGASAMAAEDAWAQACRDARWRKRRIIMNNDGSQVDSIFYCTGVFNYYTHRSEESEMLIREGVPGAFVRSFLEQGTDPLQVMIDFCRAHDFEVFWSMRMNDTHDSSNDDLLCQWKRDHPEYLVGEKGKRLPYGCNRWSSVDYALKPVRDKVYRILEDVATRYDVDGLELDFFRHPVLFRPQMTGESVTQAHRDMLTELMRRVRAMTDKAGRARQKPMLVAIRVPDSGAYCRALGIDLGRWLDEGLVDVLTGGGYFHMTPWADWAEFGHEHDVPTYACLVSRRLMNGGKPEAETAQKIWRGEALNAWEAGVDGIYTFNRFDPTDAIFRELGDPDLLRTLQHTRQESFVADIWSRPGTWLKGGDAFVQETAES